MSGVGTRMRGKSNIPLWMSKHPLESIVQVWEGEDSHLYIKPSEWPIIRFFIGQSASYVILTVLVIGPVGGKGGIGLTPLLARLYNIYTTTKR